MHYFHKLLHIRVAMLNLFLKQLISAFTTKDFTLNTVNMIH